MIALLKKELLYYFKNIKELIVISFLFTSIILLGVFAFTAQTKLPDQLPGLLLWLALVSAVQLSAASAWQRHHESGEIELFQLLPWLLELTILGKYLGFVFILCLQLAVLVPLSSLWLGVPTAQWEQCWLGLSIGAAGLSAIHLLVAGLMAGYRKGAAMLGLMTLPFSIPIIIFGTEYLRQPHLWHESLGFVIGYSGLMVPLMCAATAQSMRHGN